MNSFLGHLSFVSVYLDVILIFSKTKSETEEHLNQVLQILKDNHLHAKSSKCLFFQERMMGHVLTPSGVILSSSRLEALRHGPSLRISNSAKLPWICELSPPTHAHIFSDCCASEPTADKEEIVHLD